MQRWLAAAWLLGGLAATPARADIPREPLPLTSTSEPSKPAQPSRSKPTPFIRMMDVQIDGAFPVDEPFVLRILRQHSGHVRRCYEAALAKEPQLAGHVKPRLTLASNGSVAKVEDAGSDLPDLVAAQCVIKAFSSLPFPRPDGAVAITFTVALRPQ